MTQGLLQDNRMTTHKKGLLNKVKIIPTPDFRTFDFDEMEGKPQTDAENKKIHNKIVNEPSKPMTDSGESFEHAVHRAFGALKKIIDEKGNKIITTHNSMYGLLKLWEQEGRPQELSQKFREKYVNQDTPEKNQKSTGEHFEIKDKNGIIYVVRHGETSDNAKGVFRTAYAELTDKGKKEAEKLGQELKDCHITKIYSSDLSRAIETSKIIKKIIE